MTLHGAISFTLLGLAFLAPALACGFLILACLSNARGLSARFLVWSAMGGAAVLGAVYMTATTEIAPMLGLALFGAGFSLGAFSLSLWLIFRRALSGSAMQPTGRKAT